MGAWRMRRRGRVVSLRLMKAGGRGGCRRASAQALRDAGQGSTGRETPATASSFTVNSRRKPQVYISIPHTAPKLAPPTHVPR